MIIWNDITESKPLLSTKYIIYTRFGEIKTYTFMGEEDDPDITHWAEFDTPKSGPIESGVMFTLEDDLPTLQRLTRDNFHLWLGALGRLRKCRERKNALLKILKDCEILLDPLGRKSISMLVREGMTKRIHDAIHGGGE